MIHIIGVDHIVQYKNDYSNIRLIEEFMDYLKKRCLARKIVLIAEEFSEDSLRMSNTSYSTAREVAKELKIEHRFCDPDLSKREQLGISRSQILSKHGIGVTATNDEWKKIEEEERKNHPIREEYWLEKIKDRLNKNIIFICGDSHVDVPRVKSDFCCKFSGELSPV